MISSPPPPQAASASGDVDDVVHGDLSSTPYPVYLSEGASRASVCVGLPIAVPRPWLWLVSFPRSFFIYTIPCL